MHSITCFYEVMAFLICENICFHNEIHKKRNNKTKPNITVKFLCQFYAIISTFKINLKYHYKYLEIAREIQISNLCKLKLLIVYFLVISNYGFNYKDEANLG